jgi:survival-of-motor-neuron-related-splicing factor 30
LFIQSSRREDLEKQREYLKKKKQKKQEKMKELEKVRETDKNKWLSFKTKVRRTYALLFLRSFYQKLC